MLSEEGSETGESGGGGFAVGDGEDGAEVYAVSQGIEVGESVGGVALGGFGKVEVCDGGEGCVCCCGLTGRMERKEVRDGVKRCGDQRMWMIDDREHFVLVEDGKKTEVDLRSQHIILIGSHKG